MCHFSKKISILQKTNVYFETLLFLYIPLIFFLSILVYTLNTCMSILSVYIHVRVLPE